MTEVAREPLRAFQQVRQEIDDELGTGSGMSIDEAWTRLGPTARVCWLLCETVVSVRDGFHIWIQHFADAERAELDGPEYLARIAWFGRHLDPGIADLMRWTAARGAATRAGWRGEALFSAVVPIWGASIDPAWDWVQAVTERWPEGLQPADLPRAPALDRSPMERRPTLAFDAVLESVAQRGADGVLDLALRAYFDAGASDDQIDRFYGEARLADAESLLAWLETAFDVAGAEGRADELERAMNPLLAALGITEYPADGIVRVPLGELEALRERIDPIAHFVRLDEPGEEVPLAQRMRRALRMDVGLFIGPESVRDDDARRMMTNMALTGSLFVLGVSD